MPTRTAARTPLPGVGSPPAVCTAVVGLQWGDEGKGKIVDVLAADHYAVVRYNGGANAGHTVWIRGNRYAMHLVPSGVLTPGTYAVIGNGVVVDPDTLLAELSTLQQAGVDTSRLIVSSRAHVVMPYHKQEDAIRETILAGAAEDEPAGGAPQTAGKPDRSIGTTRRGIGPAYADKVHRAAAVRIGDLLDPAALRERIELACNLKSRTLPRLIAHLPADVHPHFDPARLHAQAVEWGERLRPFVQDTAYFLHDALRDGRRLLFEGANATLLDLDHGTFPYVTSSSCSALGVGPGSGVPERCLGRVVGVLKAYSTRVGAGPMPTEQANEIGERIRQRGKEFGTTTGRPRRTGWLDLVAVRYAAMLNGATCLAVTLLDVLAGFDELKICTAYDIDGERTDRFPPDARMLERARPVYESLPGFGDDITAVRDRADLPPAARAYLDRIEEALGVPIEMVGVGPGREQTLISGAAVV